MGLNLPDFTVPASLHQKFSFFNQWDDCLFSVNPNNPNKALKTMITTNPPNTVNDLLLFTTSLKHFPH
jgi:hypothetical protein